MTATSSRWYANVRAHVAARARAATLGAAFLISLSAQAAAAATCVATPVEDANPQHGIRTGLSAPALDDVWVSGTIALGTTRTFPYVEHFDSVVGWSTTVLPSMHESAFNAIASLSSTQAMAVGFGNGGATAIAVLFDGAVWSETLGGPGTSRVRGALQRIAAVPHTTVAYAVLAYGDANMMLWNGSAWSAVADSERVGSIRNVAASSAHDVWAVGGWTNRNGELHAVVERFDGRSWLTLPSPGPLTMLTSVDPRSRGDAWVTGLQQHGYYFTPFAAHWNGTSWQRVGLPFDNTPSAVYGDFYSASASDAWVGASVPRRDGGAMSSLWHWNGHAWRYVTGGAGWSDTPIVAGFQETLWFAGGPYRRSQHEGNRYIGFARCT